MRYTQGFKMNVKSDTMDMPWLDSYNLIVGKAKFGEQWNYVIDRGIILASVLFFALGKGHGGLWLCLGFFIFKMCAWMQAMFLTTQATRYDETLEIQEKKKDGEVVTPEETWVVVK